MRQANGYRVYNQAQLETATQIRALRDLDVPLEEIALLLRGDLSTAALLEQHETRLIGRFVAQRNALIALQGLLRGKRQTQDLKVQQMLVPASHVLSIRAFVAWEAGSTFAQTAIAAFWEVLQQQNAQAAGQPLVLQHNIGFVVTHLDLEFVLPVSKALHGTTRVRAGQIANMRLMVVRHNKTPQTAFPLYRQLFLHLENQGIQLGTAVWLEEEGLLGYEIKEQS